MGSSPADLDLVGLLARWRTGDLLARDQLFRALRGWLVPMARRLARRRGGGTGEDAVQDVLLRFLRDAPTHTFPHDGAVLRWCGVVLRRRLTRAGDLLERPIAAAGEPADPRPGPEENATRRLDRETRMARLRTVVRDNRRLGLHDEGRRRFLVFIDHLDDVANGVAEESADLRSLASRFGFDRAVLWRVVRCLGGRVGSARRPGR